MCGCGYSDLCGYRSNPSSFKLINRIFVERIRYKLIEDEDENCQFTRPVRIRFTFSLNYKRYKLSDRTFDKIGTLD